MVSMIMISLVGVLIVSLVGVFGMYQAKEGQGMVSSAEKSLEVAQQSDQVKGSAARLNELVEGFKI